MIGEPSYDRWDLGLFIFALAGSFLSLAAALSLLAIGLFAFAGGNADGARAVQWSSTGFFALSLLGVPPIISVGRRILGAPPAPTSPPSRRWLFLGLLLPLGLLLGYMAFERDFLPGLIGPAGQLLAVGAPAAVIIVLLRKVGPDHRPRRAWTHFLLGLWAVPIIALLAEAVMLVIGGVLGAAALSITPGGRRWMERLESLADPLNPNLAPDSLVEIVRHPLVVILVLVFLGLLVPIVEEILKTMVVWPFLPARPRPSEAFLGGALGGTGFALAEALFVTQPVTGWMVTAIARSGATLMHALATAIACWGLAVGISQRRWLRGLMALAVAIGLHGLWNASAVAIGLSQLTSEGEFAATPQPVAIAGASVLVVLTSLALFGLPVLLQRTLRAETAAGANS